jgi:hypothetical protein
MSSYSEYLNRKMQRTPKYIDTRPHRDAGHQTEVVKRLAAATVLEQRNPSSAGNMKLNAPSTQVVSRYAKAHSVQDTALYNEYTAGQAVAEGALAVNKKTPQIQATCYTSTTVPEFNDKLRTDTTLAAVQKAKNTYQRGWSNCCKLCGEPAQESGSCNCRLTVAQQVALPTSG